MARKRKTVVMHSFVDSVVNMVRAKFIKEGVNMGYSDTVNFLLLLSFKLSSSCSASDLSEVLELFNKSYSGYDVVGVDVSKLISMLDEVVK